MKQKRITVILIVFLLIFGAIFYLESRKIKRSDIVLGETDSDIEISVVASSDDMVRRIENKTSLYERAKEVTTPDGFINTDKIKVADLVGKKVILVDFWTYSCINCQRTLPYLNSWNEKYSDKGLVILGIHTPEFEFEKGYENVKRATEKFGVKYPVILDNDYSTWTSYKNRYWPRKYLIDIDGFIVYDHIGEGAYDETEKKIVELLNERSQTLSKDAVVMIDKSPIGVEIMDLSKVRTPETYLGYGRVEYLTNLPSQTCFNKVCDFIAPDKISLNTYALAGKWKIAKEESSITEGVGEIIIRFSANKVNLVAGSIENSAKAQILLDGKLVDASVAGADVSSDGVVTFKEHDLYNLIDLRGDYGEHELIIRITEPGVQAFAFTFG